MELRQLTYFVAVAEELHFGRAAERLHLSTPSLSQQIRNLERELGAELLIRDRRHVELTPTGATFLIDAKDVLAAADRAVDHARSGSTEAPLRLGYVSWLPPQVTSLTDVRVRPDEWLLPSFDQVGRLAEGSLDLAIAWADRATIDEHHLKAHVLWNEQLEAVVPRSYRAPKDGALQANEVAVLIDVDDSTWRAWNSFATGFAVASGATVVHISDGGVVGAAFYDHVERLRRPVVSSPKRYITAVPPSLANHRVESPVPVWTWYLLQREDDDRESVARLTQALIELAGVSGWRDPVKAPHWPPDDY